MRFVVLLVRFARMKSRHSKWMSWCTPFMMVHGVYHRRVCLCTWYTIPSNATSTVKPNPSEFECPLQLIERFFGGSFIIFSIIYFFSSLELALFLNTKNAAAQSRRTKPSPCSESSLPPPSPLPVTSRINQNYNSNYRTAKIHHTPSHVGTSN